MEKIVFEKNDYLLYGFEECGNHVIPPHYQPKKFCGDTVLWLLPTDKTQKAKRLTIGAYTVKTGRKKVTVTFDGDSNEKEFEARPCCDFFGNRLSFDIPYRECFEKAFSEFYWENLLNQIAERTFMRKKKGIREGYVLSTLDKKAYAGTYPAVDHEFHMKGRFAVGGKTEADLIKRMLLLQIKLMRQDRKRLYRNVCSVQPNLRREYNVWRKSQSLKQKAQMFRITANIEFVEGVYLYYSLTKDLGFIREYLDDIEKNCAYIERFITADGFLDSHVYFEDQVIKDFSVLQAQLFAAHSFTMMAEIERLSGREEKAEHYLTVSRQLGEKAVLAYPQGFWDEENRRFIDWIDAKGQKHDRIHLLANELPELFGFASERQIAACRKTIEDNKEVFEKFPSFVAAKIDEYTPDEIGSGGPYDLCAAGRYWCWDAEYAAYRKDGEKLLSQLLQVCRQAEEDGYAMGERYDMNYIYYNTGADAGRNWHGASHYYEYPNVWIYVFICKYLGLQKGFDCDFVLTPLFKEGTVRMEQYGIEYTVKNQRLTGIKNSGDKDLTVRLPDENKTVFLRKGEEYGKW